MFARVNKLLKRYGVRCENTEFWGNVYDTCQRLFPPSPDVGTVWTYNELLFHYYVSWCCHQMQIAIQSFVFWELKNLFGVARELNGKAPHHPSPHDADEKIA